MMTRYNARTTNPSKFLEPKFNTNPDYQNKISKQIIKTNYQNNLLIEPTNLFYIRAEMQKYFYSFFGSNENCRICF